MFIAIAGGTGFIGSALTTHFLQHGHTVYIFSRGNSETSDHPNLIYVKWLGPDDHPENQIDRLDVFINLAGESINSGRWTTERKARIMETRIVATNAVIDLLRHLPNKPSLLINASAIGIYGTSLNETFDEQTTTYGNDFLAETVVAWEAHAKKAEDLGIRVAFVRFGIVLDKHGGALPKMVMPYRFMVGGNVGSGEQWLSWIHIDDVVRSIQFIITEQLSGPFNITAPTPEKMESFGKSIGRNANKPHWIPVPSFALKILLGEMSTLVLEGQRVLPKRLMDSGFQFKYEKLDEALKSILG
ncbi:TIGR01777 family oxidoreductase [Bacillus sp. PS06]|uniref:TIGR01777 family oxidoreductase n=1 Tax=Bacillus sp. PS06 TaxID=2764176 RepID=UPI00177BA64C|nr:TIGR01777 family oxidoreductase [Bacillus sp. PS06]MBD8071218.1 TIGR01777 family protein [Bacillus sp. PS06]